MSEHHKRILAAIAAAVILPLALVEAIAAYRLPARVATPADWSGAAAEVKRGFAEGDLLIFAPAWLDPLGRSHLGELTPPAMLGRASDDRYARIWVVGMRDAQPDAVRGATLRSSQRHGQLTVSLYEKPAVRVLTDLVERFDAARVSIVRGGDEKPCLVDGPGRKCPQSRVERRITEVEYEPRRAVLAPIEAGGTTRVEWDVELGGKLVIFVGLHDYYARKVADGKLTVRVAIDGAEKHAVEHANGDGWRRIELATAGLAGSHTVRVEVSAKAAAWRLAAIAGEVQQ